MGTLAGSASSAGALSDAPPPTDTLASARAGAREELLRGERLQQRVGLQDFPVPRSAPRDLVLEQRQQLQVLREDVQ
jgi:hypothetical protein